MKLFPKVLLLSVLLMPFAGGTLADDNTEAEIQHLLEFVAASGCDFKRNGSVHEPASAADHLRLKYRRGAKYVNSAEQFIDRLATKSSWSGKAYTVTCDGVTQPSGDWLHTELDAYRQSQT